MALPVLSEKLSEAGAEVEQIVAYESRDVTDVDEMILAELQAGQINWVTVTSSATAGSLLRLFGTDSAEWGGAKVAAISPLTAAALEEAGFPATVVATESTAGGLVDAVLKLNHEGHKEH
jgi:uroporphyrinogen III methyltransferase/synthase